MSGNGDSAGFQRVDELPVPSQRLQYISNLHCRAAVLHHYSGIAARGSPRSRWIRDFRMPMASHAGDGAVAELAPARRVAVVQMQGRPQTGCRFGAPI